MRHRAVVISAMALGTTWLGGGVARAAATETGAAVGTSGALAVVQSASPAAASAAEVSPTLPSTPVQFTVGLSLREPAQATALAREVSDPASPSYTHFLTPAEWEARFSPPQAAVDAVSSWLRSQEITVLGVTPDRMTIEASAPAATVERAFATGLGEFDVQGRTLRLTTRALSVPASIAPLIVGIGGIDEIPARRQAPRRAELPQGAANPAPATRGLSPAFVVGKPCSAYYGQKYDTTDPPYAAKYPEPLPYAVCGYTPKQIQGAYGLSPYIAAGSNGRGVKIAIVDALASPSLFADAHRYSEINQPAEPLEKNRFKEVLDTPFEVSQLCIEEEEWSDEQHLDVEAVHVTAPGAHIVYVGAETCTLAALESAVQQVVDGHLADVLTDSWGDEGELFEPEGTRKAFDNVLMMADATGIGVLFAAGDEGDGFPVVGSNMAEYPAVSPYVTAVGGTAVQIGKHDERLGEVGWSTGRSILCTDVLAQLEFPGCTAGRLERWLPPAPGEFLYGGGGDTSMVYPEPAYQEGVVPAPLAERNSFITHTRNRVIPDISMDGEPSTGLRVGELQEFPSGPRYNESRAGGTSLSSPLLAGVLADADQAAGKALGFVNPLLYKLDSLPATASKAFFDILPAGKQALARIDYLNEINATEGTLHSARVLESEGRQEYCDEAGNCAHEKNILSTAVGYDSMTGIGAPGDGLIGELAGR